MKMRDGIENLALIQNKFKMILKELIIASLFSACLTGCYNKSIEKEIELLNESYATIISEFDNKVQDSLDYTNPYYFILLEFSNLVDSTILSIRELENRDLRIISDVQERINIYSNDDSLKNLSKILLRKTQDAGLKLEKSLLTLKNALSKELLQRAVINDDSIITIPELIPIDKSLLKHQNMEAFLKIPNKWDNQVIIQSPDSMRYVVLGESFIYFSGKMRGVNDSITIFVNSSDSNIKPDNIKLTAYFYLVNEETLNEN